MGAARIGHGVRAIEDPALVSELARKGITLECCLTSNVQTGAVSSLADHPLRKLLAAGVRVTINTDNPTVSATTLAKEFALARQVLGVTEAEEALLHKNAAEACFPR
jgi:adenosine deaminase